MTVYIIAAPSEGLGAFRNGSRTITSGEFMTTRLRIGLTLALVCVVALAPSEKLGRCSDSPPYAKSDVLCGHRCAHFLLNYCDVDASLSDVIDAFNTHSHSDDSLLSMKDIAHYIASRGVPCTAVASRRAIELQASVPCMIHLTDKGASSGHFVILLKADDDYCRLWDGLRGISQIPTTQLNGLYSGSAIIVNTTGDGTSAILSFYPSLNRLGVCFSILLCSLWIWAWRRRRLTPVSEAAPHDSLPIAPETTS
jgi:hypothetical protein